MPSKRKPPANAGRRNRIAKALPRLGHLVEPSAKAYTRKGRSAPRDRPSYFGEGCGWVDADAALPSDTRLCASSAKSRG